MEIRNHEQGSQETDQFREGFRPATTGFPRYFPELNTSCSSVHVAGPSIADM